MTHEPAALDEALAARIMQAVDDGFEAQTEFTREPIRYPSVRGQGHTAQDFIHHALSERGYVMDRWAIDETALRDHPGFSRVTVDYANAINVVGTHRPRVEAGRSLILNGHIDVVPTGPADMWTRPPFEPWIDGDWLYDRGSADKKAGLVANIAALPGPGRLLLACPDRQSSWHFRVSAPLASLSASVASPAPPEAVSVQT